MVKTELDFHERLAILGRKHAAMCKGYVMRMRPDGLIVVDLKRPRSLRLAPLKALFLLLLGFCVFKAIMVTSVGEATYNERVAKLEQGTVMEQGGAWLMQVDPATAFFSELLKPITG